MAKEMNVTKSAYVQVRFTSNPECITAYKNALCWYNFPKCGNYNESLPLCKSSCESYYGACGYKPGSDGTFQTHEQDKEDEAFGLCSEARTELDGLFASGVTGPDHLYGEAKITCNKTYGPAQKIWEADEANKVDYSWIIIPAVIFVLVIISIWVLLRLKRFLASQEFQERIAPLIDKINAIRGPLSERMAEWPIDCIGFCVLLSIGAILGLFIFGVYRHMTSEHGSLERFEPAPDEKALEDQTHVSPSFAFPLLMKVKLTHQQLKELDGVCTCTGGVTQIGFSWCTLWSVMLSSFWH